MTRHQSSTSLSDQDKLEDHSPDASCGIMFDAGTGLYTGAKGYFQQIATEPNKTIGSPLDE